ncbi:hypothetical protein Tcan_04090 [Toxocara canis]|uniref:Uncharacterized protein n=2 Tax=Toxocara canis TaxID=6265 RepID=A0A0B2UZ04_TOXCA|nr:hypothetical protein Tcan_04090 [Toxocara canis]VDM26817.1 unnamed protein product [Toxocara canis]
MQFHQSSKAGELYSVFIPQETLVHQGVELRNRQRVGLRDRRLQRLQVRILPQSQLSATKPGKMRLVLSGRCRSQRSYPRQEGGVRDAWKCYDRKDDLGKEVAVPVDVGLPAIR